jgi:hypothetical protein
MSDNKQLPAASFFGLEISGMPVDPNHCFAYSLRWVQIPEGGGAKMVLYYYGRRVICSWKLVANYTANEDTCGGNANTA